MRLFLALCREVFLFCCLFRVVFADGYIALYDIITPLLQKLIYNIICNDLQVKGFKFDPGIR